MRAKYLCQWLIAVKKDDSPDATNYQKDIAIIQAAFRDGTMAKECTWQTVVLITKFKRYFCGIGLFEVLWKYVEILLNLQLASDITYHDALHIFLAGHGT